MTFKREERYAVFKLKDFTDDQLELLETFKQQLPPTLLCIVVEPDWPEYNMVWRSIEERCK